jgi:hypothetical protein
VSLFIILIERGTRDPLVPLRMFGNRSLAVASQAGLAFVPLTLVTILGAGKVAPGPGPHPVPGRHHRLVRSRGATDLGRAGAPGMLGRWGVRTTLASAMLLTGIGMATVTTGMSVGGSNWALTPGVIVWGLGGGIGFVAMFAAVSSGVSTHEQGAASGLATTAQQIGGAVGLAALVAVANAGLHVGSASAPTASDLIDGLLHAAEWMAGAATAAGALIALILKRPPVPNTSPANVDSADVLVQK